MNSGSWSLEPISQDNLLVAIALGLVAILAVLTVIGMVIGARNKRRRVAAEKEEQERIAELKAEGVEADGLDDGASTREDAAAASPDGSRSGADAAPPVPSPVAPAPPPLGDQPTPGTPPEPAPLADEPIAAAAPLDASPASVAADAPVPTPAAGDADAPLTMLKGLGPKIAARLAELGVATVGQLAWLDDAEAEALDGQLGPFQGRMARDRWREQARLLASGDRAGFEREFGRLG